MSTSARYAAPTTEEAIATMREVLEAWHAERPASELSRSAQSAFGPVLFAHVAHVHRLAEGVITLQEAKQAFVAMPLIRQMIEFSMRALWLSIYHENLIEVVREGERQKKNALESASKTGLIAPDDPALRRTLDWLEENRGTKEATNGANFEQICEELNGGLGIYTQYRMASNYTHAGSILLDEYVHIEKEGDQARIMFTTKPSLNAERAWINAAAHMLILAGLTWDHVDRSHVHRALLRRIAPAYEVPTGVFHMNGKGFERWNQASKARDRAARDAYRDKK